MENRGKRKAEMKESWNKTGKEDIEMKTEEREGRDDRDERERMVRLSLQEMQFEMVQFYKVWRNEEAEE
jgi:hypothetical protein